MMNTIRVMIESGNKNKKVVAVPFDWPGWDRHGKTEEEALSVIETYRPRYRKVAELAGLGNEFDAARELAVTERVEGSGTTDFWGISAKSASIEHHQMTDEECERKLSILQACWTYFDETHPLVSAELQKGPRGGGRDRDQVVRHTYGAEHEYAKKVGVILEPGTWENPDELRAFREAYLDALRAYNAEGKPARTWTLQFCIRRTCYHMLDHAWEMEDKDLSTTQ